MKTVAELKASMIPATLGLCPDNPRLLQLFNEAEEELLQHGRWWGTVVSGEFCTTGGLVAWPRIVANVELITICGHTLPAHGMPYRFMSAVSQPVPCQSCHGHGGSHSACGACGGMVWTDEGTQPVGRQIRGARLIKLYPRSTSDVGKQVLVQGYDKNKEWVRRSYGGIWGDGERITLANPFGVSATTFLSVTGVQKAMTDKNVLAYSFDPVTNQEILLADWQPDETAPSYRVSRIPCLGHAGKNGSIRALVKLDHVPVSQDTDWLIIQNGIAIEAAMRARQFYKQNQDDAADKELMRALNALNHELRTRTGDRTEAFVDLGCESFRNDLTGFN